MLANAFARKLRAKYIAEGRAEGMAEGVATGMAEGEAKSMAAVEEAARWQGMDLEDIRRVIEQARQIARNGRA